MNEWRVNFRERSLFGLFVQHPTYSPEKTDAWLGLYGQTVVYKAKALCKRKKLLFPRSVNMTFRPSPGQASALSGCGVKASNRLILGEQAERGIAEKVRARAIRKLYVEKEALDASKFPARSSTNLV